MSDESKVGIMAAVIIIVGCTLMTIVEFLIYR